jgi:hypothetical protein
VRRRARCCGSLAVEGITLISSNSGGTDISSSLCNSSSNERMLIVRNTNSTAGVFQTQRHDRRRFAPTSWNGCSRTLVAA